MILYVQTKEVTNMDGKKSKKLLDCCLYFTLNKFTRRFNAMADDIFKKTGLAPNYAFAIMQIEDNPGITSSELAKMLSLSPSTITRFIDKLIIKGLCRRELQGKNSYLYLTGEGKKLMESIDTSWRELYEEYVQIIGEEEAIELTAQMNRLAEKFS